MVLVWIWEQWKYPASTGTEGTEDSKTIAFQTDLSMHMHRDTLGYCLAFSPPISCILKEKKKNYQLPKMLTANGLC